MALAITRKADETVVIVTPQGEEITIAVSRDCKLYITAPPDHKILRSEMLPPVMVRTEE